MHFDKEKFLASLLDVSIIISLLGALFYFFGVISTSSHMEHSRIPYNVYADWTLVENVLEGAIFVCAFVIPFSLFIYALFLVIQIIAPVSTSKLKRYFKNNLFPQHPYFITLLLVPIFVVLIRGIVFLNSYFHREYTEIPLVVQATLEDISYKSSEKKSVGLLSVSEDRYFLIRCSSDDVTFLALAKNQVKALETKPSGTMKFCEGGAE